MEDGWEIDDETISQFKDKFNSDNFKHFGGDIETFVLKIKIVFAKTNFFSTDKKITRNVLKESFDTYVSKKEADEIWRNMFI